MPQSKIPGPLERRHLVERELPAARALAIAEAYLAEGRSIEAIDFLALAGARDRLAELRRGAIDSGDVFQVRAIAQAMGEPVAREEWRALASGAARAGKHRYAAEAARQAERGEG